VPEDSRGAPHEQSSTDESTLDLLRAMNAADAAVAPAVALALPAIAEVVEAVSDCLSRGGRVFFVGAGTSGRLGVVEASEWHPTFGTKQDVVKAVMAGGKEAVFRSAEGAEDDSDQGAADLKAAGASRGDVVIGITASGTTPYVRGALHQARELGSFTAALVCHRAAELPSDVTVEITVGPEFVEGSSRLKAATATKLVLNMISTVAMMKLGRVHAGRMVHVKTLSDKLRRRAQDIVVAETGLTPEGVGDLLERAGGEPKVAIVMGRLKVSAEEARRKLEEHGWRLEAVLGESRAPVTERRRQVDLPRLFAAYAELPLRRVLGLMSGTSADGVHAALAEISGEGEATGARIIGLSHQPYDGALRGRIFRLFESDCPVPYLCEMNFALGKVFARAAEELAAAHGGIDGVHLIASHGQTVCHRPGRGAASGGAGSTLQIGEPAVIAERTGVMVAADFRVADVAAGGQGAPLSAFADYVLFRHPALGRAVQNIGGIGNVTFLPAGCRLDEVTAFDTGPGNMLIDAAAEAASGGRLECDVDGKLAAAGHVDEDLLGWLMGHEFIRAEPPKTAGREEFGAAFADEFMNRARERGLTGQDTVAVATAFTAESVADAYRRFLLPKGRLDEVILGGGGAYNVTLRGWIEERLPGVRVHTHEDFGIPGHAKEALAFAILGNEAVLGRASGMPAVTGARRPALLGKIIPGRRPLRVEPAGS
jgi:anhydro-N-acetylmuramic acid kinase